MLNEHLQDPRYANEIDHQADERRHQAWLKLASGRRIYQQWLNRNDDAIDEPVSYKGEGRSSY
jgi:hypothetical protein